jgi:hypothetical protein
MWKRRYPDTNRYTVCFDGLPRAYDGEILILDDGSNPLGGNHGLRNLGIQQECCKLLASEPSRCIPASHDSDDHLAQLRAATPKRKNGWTVDP